MKFGPEHAKPLRLLPDYTCRSLALTKPLPFPCNATKCFLVFLIFLGNLVLSENVKVSEYTWGTTQTRSKPGRKLLLVMLCDEICWRVFLYHITWAPLCDSISHSLIYYDYYGFHTSSSQASHSKLHSYDKIITLYGENRTSGRNPPHYAVQNHLGYGGSELILVLLSLIFAFFAIFRSFIMHHPVVCCPYSDSCTMLLYWLHLEESGMQIWNIIVVLVFGVSSRRIPLPNISRPIGTLPLVLSKCSTVWWPASSPESSPRWLQLRKMSYK